LIKLNLSGQTLEKLRHLVNVKDDCTYEFLGFTLNLETSALKDTMNPKATAMLTQWHIQLLSTLLTHYSQAKPVPLTGNLVNFKDMPGGYAYEHAFIKRAINPIAEFFEKTPQYLPQIGKLLGGIQLSHGDASVQIMALEGITLTYILWKAEEFPASANILYDKAASNYLPTEDLAVLGEITTGRLIEICSMLNV
jgi:hypothetical protein